MDSDREHGDAQSERQGNNISRHGHVDDIPDQGTPPSLCISFDFSRWRLILISRQTPPCANSTLEQVFPLSTSIAPSPRTAFITRTPGIAFAMCRVKHVVGRHNSRNPFRSPAVWGHTCASGTHGDVLNQKQLPTPYPARLVCAKTLLECGGVPLYVS